MLKNILVKKFCDVNNIMHEKKIQTKQTKISFLNKFLINYERGYTK